MGCRSRLGQYSWANMSHRSFRWDRQDWRLLSSYKPSSFHVYLCCQLGWMAFSRECIRTAFRHYVSSSGHV